MYIGYSFPYDAAKKKKTITSLRIRFAAFHLLFLDCGPNPQQQQKHVTNYDICLQMKWTS